MVDLITFDEVLNKAKSYNPDLDCERVKKAFDYAQKLHAGEYRMSGEPAISHYLAVVDILLSLRPDEDTIVAGFLHGVKNVPDFNEEEFRNLFGNNILFLITAVDSLKKIQSSDQSDEAESIRGMFITMAKDLRVILIKIADRLHNMETVDFLPVSKQKQIARETLDIFVPISARLGMYQFKGKLEDHAFRCLYPSQYEHLKNELDEYISERERNIDDIKYELENFLMDNGVVARIEGRIKNLYSIYRKLKLKNHSTLRDLYDVFAIRVIVENKLTNGREYNEHLYGILGLIHSKWRPMPQRFKDYVAIPKPNGYQSLHTAVIGLSPKSSQATEIQIRTERMHEEAEFGVASHWLYDQSKKAKNSKETDYSLQKMGADISPTRKYVYWIEALSKMQKELKSGAELKMALRMDFFSDRIFVMTPTGEVKDLPSGSTPVDFAYAVHTDIGHRCQLAKVNGVAVPLDYKLRNGEVVEIVLSNKAKPNSLWLSFVKTQGAKNKIKTFFKSEDGEKSYRDGRSLINKHLKRLNKPVLDDDLSILRYYNGERLSKRERESLIEEVGNGSKLVSTLLRKVFGKEFVVEDRKARSLARRRIQFSLPKRVGKRQLNEDEIFISGEGGLPYRLANCCKPKKGLEIVGYLSRGPYVSIHLQKCKLLRAAPSERIVEATWGNQTLDKGFPVKISLTSKNRVGLIRDIADVITAMNITILLFSDSGKNDDVIKRDIVLEVLDDHQLADVMNKLERIRDVLDVKREKSSK